MSRVPGPMARVLFPLCAFWLGGCPDGRGSSAPIPTGGATEETAVKSHEASGGTAALLAPAEAPRCLIPESDPAPAPVASRQDCPPDPDRPVMPEGSVSFAGSGAPVLRVEVAKTDTHRTHGLMFRSKLSEDEGMLFSWPSEAPRSFWMHNTCLALDMLFLDARGFVVGTLEQVPPWNDAPRRVRCPAAHVLEVRAGWARDHGVKPGARATFDGAAAD